MSDGNVSKSKIEFTPGLSFDELNELYDKEHKDNRRSMSYEQFFGEMDLTDKQKEERRTLAQDVDDIILLYLIMMFYMRRNQTFDYASVVAGLEEDLGKAVKDRNITNAPSFTATHISEVASSIVNTTAINPDDPFMYSYDRAMLIAENEANSVYNDSDYQEAIQSGKTQKEWRAILDKRTRDTHRDINGTVLPIEEPFEVGEYLMMYPRDESFGAGMEEIANCRCSVVYY